MVLKYDSGDFLVSEAGTSLLNMKPSRILLLFPLVGFSLFSSCANPHFFPRTRPLFIGLNCQDHPASQLVALKHAKADFLQARHGKVPLYARHVRTIPNSLSKVYQGDGYEIIMVNDTSFTWHRLGPKIVLESKITGGKPIQYDEVDEITS